MTAEVPDNFGRSKLDSDIARRIEEFRKQQIKEKPFEQLFQEQVEGIIQNQSPIPEEGEVIFPEQSIEILGMKTLSDLDILINSMTSEELENSQEDKDVLSAFYINDLFVREKIAQIVEPLLMRATQSVYLTENENIGYSYLESKDEKDLKSGVYLLLEEDRLSDDCIAPLDDAASIQEVWDMSNQYVRSDIISFAAYTKGDVIDLFYRYTRAYAYPKMDFDS